MKTGYKRLLVFSIILIILAMFNSFFINIFEGYGLTIILIIILAIFDRIFIIEKDRHRYLKDILFEIFVFVVTFFIFYYLLGFVVGLARTPEYLSLEGIATKILPIILYCVLREVFRYNMLCKADRNLLCTIIVIILFIMLDTSNTLYYTNFRSQYDILKFIALSFLPAISKNISYSYISKRCGYKPVIAFDLIFSLYLYILPIVPNFNEYVISIIYLLIPILFAYRLYLFLNAKSHDRIPESYKVGKVKSILIPLLIIFTMVYFYSGYFRFYAIAVASGSMSPNIKKGDLAIVDQKYDYNEIIIGDVLAVKKNGIIIVHRVVKRVNIGDSYVYYTKGDANNNMDDFVIKEDMVIGKVKFKIPYIGYPTVWFNE